VLTRTLPGRWLESRTVTANSLPYSTIRTRISIRARQLPSSRIGNSLQMKRALLTADVKGEEKMATAAAGYGGTDKTISSVDPVCSLRSRAAPA
jgi:hypothetical protein